MKRDKSRERALGIAFGFMIMAFLLVGYAAAAHGAGTEFYNGKEVAAGEVLVKFRAETPDVISQVQIGENLDEAEHVGSAHVLRLHSKGKNVATLISDLSARGDVEYAEPNYIVHALGTTPNDPSFGQLWGLDNTGQSILGVSGTPGADISASEAWGITTGSPTNVVAVVDTGIDYTHPDLAANIWSAPNDYTVTIGGSTITCPAGSHGFNAITNTCDPLDDNNHGTHVSGTIGAVGNNGEGVVGVNWRASIIGAKFLDASGSGTLANAINAIDFVIQAKDHFGTGANVRVLSNSWGGGGYSQALLNEINKANADGMLFVAAAGNSGTNNGVTLFFPADYVMYGANNVVAVAATDNKDTLASFSNYGSTTVALGAPGVNILSTIRSTGYAYYSGTSMATPHVSGAAALILSKCTLSTADLKADILNNVDPVPSLAGKTVTGGRLNVYKAIQACSAPTTSTTTTVTASPDSSTYGDPVTFTATVTPSGGTVTPTGTVTFYNETTVLGTGTLAGGQATITTSTLSGAVHSITATYGGDSSFGSSTSPVLLYTVNPAPTSLALTGSPTTPTFGQTVTFTATVTPVTAAGTVTFYDGPASLGTVTLISGTALLSTSTMPVGTHTITATYKGNTNYQTSTSVPVSLTVSQATSTTALASSPNPSTVGQTVTFTATVLPAAATGTVTFLDGGSAFGTGTLSGGRASLSTSSLSIGSHQITATYGGDSNAACSTSSPLTQTVNSAPAGDFSISASPSSRTVNRGSSTTYAVSIKRVSGFTGSVGLSVSGLPSGASGTFSTNPITNPGTSSTLTVRTTSTTPTGTSRLTITGSSGSLVHTTTVTLQIQRSIFGFSSRATGTEVDTTPDGS